MDALAHVGWCRQECLVFVCERARAGHERERKKITERKKTETATAKRERERDGCRDSKKRESGAEKRQRQRKRVRGRESNGGKGRK
jgi:hypothetical protein